MSYTQEQKNKELAEFLGYDYDETTHKLTKDGLATDIKWIPQFDYNQLFWLLDRICEHGYKYLIMDDIFEVSKKGKLILSKQDRNIKQSLFNGIFEIITTKFGLRNED